MKLRMKRLQTQFITEISQIVLRELKDPRLDGAFITVTDVDIAPDLKNAKVYVSFLSGNALEAMQGLRSSAGYIRTTLGKRLHIKRIPQLDFVLDDSAERSDRISRHLNRLNDEDGSSEGMNE